VGLHIVPHFGYVLAIVEIAADFATTMQTDFVRCTVIKGPE
jgi:hypothetical protein